MTRVVVSVGTDHHPFDRLVEWSVFAAARLGASLVIQAGATDLPAGVEAFDFVSASEMASLMGAADVVVCHAGPGTISLARSVGHRPIVVPRDPSFGEHVDDHQLRFAAKLSSENAIDVATSRDELVAWLSASRPRPQAMETDSIDCAVREFANLVERLISGELRSRSWRERFLIRRVDRRHENSESR